MKVKVDKAHLEERFTRDRETSSQLEPQGCGEEENSRRRDWKSGKDLERRWSLGPKQDPLEMLRGSPMLLKE
jgi:hypothetical protein